MNAKKNLNRIRSRRAIRARAKITGTADKPRLSVFRSNRYIYAQLIDDIKGHTLASASAIEAKSKEAKTVQAEKVGAALAKKASSAGVKQAVFDRGEYKYHGRVKAVAEGARKEGLKI